MNELGNFVAYCEGRKENPFKIVKNLECNSSSFMILRRFAPSKKKNVKISPKYNDDYQIRQNETDVTSAAISKDYKCK